MSAIAIETPVDAFLPLGFPERLESELVRDGKSLSKTFDWNYVLTDNDIPPTRLLNIIMLSFQRAAPINEPYGLGRIEFSMIIWNTFLQISQCHSLLVTLYQRHLV
ncbi:hypothetical protein BDV34DRAFT_223734 [Aspergillus parasiticus]|uniref:Uncharacterized protein n=1 Tax=Aspergillus parasiticus TaxID=5067 RepID=A0A5N6DPU8_ASPPA|nr:hypothetical protein BDV34DRAFT_223734 [Aspergillus parasiticus]